MADNDNTYRATEEKKDPWGLARSSIERGSSLQIEDVRSRFIVERTSDINDLNGVSAMRTETTPSKGVGDALGRYPVKSSNYIR